MAVAGCSIPFPRVFLTISLPFPYHSLTKFATRCEGHCCILLQYHCHGSGGPWSWPSPWPGFLIESGYRKGHVLSVFYGSRCFVYGNIPVIYGILWFTRLPNLQQERRVPSGDCWWFHTIPIRCPYHSLSIPLPLADQICNKM